MTKIVALDPGTEQTAFVCYDKGEILNHGIASNQQIIDSIPTWRFSGASLAVEMIASYGMPVGKEVFETCVWTGRFIQAWGGPYRLIYRQEVKLHLCQSPRAKDANVRQALLDLLGPQGTKKAPGPTYGIKTHEWAALGVAVTAAHLEANK